MRNKNRTDVFRTHIPRPSTSRQLDVDSYPISTDPLPDLGGKRFADSVVVALVVARHRANHPHRIHVEQRESDGL